MRFRLEDNGDEVLLVIALDRAGAAEMIGELAAFLSAPAVPAPKAKPKRKPRPEPAAESTPEPTPKPRGSRGSRGSRAGLGKYGPVADFFVAGRVWNALVEGEPDLGERLGVKLRPWGGKGGERAEFHEATPAVRRSVGEALSNLAQKPTTDKGLRAAVMKELQRING